MELGCHVASKLTSQPAMFLWLLPLFGPVYGLNNVALGKPTNQSSWLTAYKAVDGNTNPSYEAGELRSEVYVTMYVNLG